MKALLVFFIFTNIFAQVENSQLIETIDKHIEDISWRKYRCEEMDALKLTYLDELQVTKDEILLAGNSELTIPQVIGTLLAGGILANEINRSIKINYSKNFNLKESLNVDTKRVDFISNITKDSKYFDLKDIQRLEAQNKYLDDLLKLMPTSNIDEVKSLKTQIRNIKKVNVLQINQVKSFYNWAAGSFNNGFKMETIESVWKGSHKFEYLDFYGPDRISKSSWLNKKQTIEMIKDKMRIHYNKIHASQIAKVNTLRNISLLKKVFITKKKLPNKSSLKNVFKNTIKSTSKTGLKKLATFGSAILIALPSFALDFSLDVFGSGFSSSPDNNHLFREDPKLLLSLQENEACEMVERYELVRESAISSVSDQNLQIYNQFPSITNSSINKTDNDDSYQYAGNYGDDVIKN